MSAPPLFEVLRRAYAHIEVTGRIAAANGEAASDGFAFHRYVASRARRRGAHARHARAAAGSPPHPLAEVGVGTHDARLRLRRARERRRLHHRLAPPDPT